MYHSTRLEIPPIYFYILIILKLFCRFRIYFKNNFSFIVNSNYVYNAGIQSKLIKRILSRVNSTEYSLRIELYIIQTKL